MRCAEHVEGDLRDSDKQRSYRDQPRWRTREHKSFLTLQIFRGYLFLSILESIKTDSIGVQARRVNKEGDLEVDHSLFIYCVVQNSFRNSENGFEKQVWAGPLCEERRVVLLLNRADKGSSPITARWKDIGIPSGIAVEARDVWKV